MSKCLGFIGLILAIMLVGAPSQRAKAASVHFSYEGIMPSLFEIETGIPDDPAAGVIGRFDVDLSEIAATGETYLSIQSFRNFFFMYFQDETLLAVYEPLDLNGDGGIVVSRDTDGIEVLGGYGSFIRTTLGFPILSATDPYDVYDVVVNDDMIPIVGHDTALGAWEAGVSEVPVPAAGLLFAPVVLGGLLLARRGRRMS